jgi:hypothetical protein
MIDEKIQNDHHVSTDHKCMACRLAHKRCDKVIQIIICTILLFVISTLERCLSTQAYTLNNLYKIDRVQFVSCSTLVLIIAFVGLVIFGNGASSPQDGTGPFNGIDISIQI